MPSEVIQVRVPSALKAQAEAVFAAIGMKTGEAMRVFLQQVVNSNGLPFQPHAKTPNAETLQAFYESENSLGTPVTLEELRKQFELK